VVAEYFWTVAQVAGPYAAADQRSDVLTVYSKGSVIVAFPKVCDVFLSSLLKYFMPLSPFRILLDSAVQALS
jgi:hypothetical protein